MSVTGVALVLFLTFHACMNVVALISEDGYNWICEMLGANWYAVVATVGLAVLVLIHFIYAFWLTFQNWKARGNDRYAVSGKQPVHWAAKNMLALGVIIVCGLLVHLFNFWHKMMFAELAGIEGQFAPTAGFDWITYNFGFGILDIVYLVWFCALWYHMTHGIWSAMQTLGLNGKVWLNRWICISYVWATVIVCGFVLVLLAAVVQNGFALNWGCC